MDAGQAHIKIVENGFLNGMEHVEETVGEPGKHKIAEHIGYLHRLLKILVAENLNCDIAFGFGYGPGRPWCMNSGSVSRPGRVCSHHRYRSGPGG